MGKEVQEKGREHWMYGIFLTDQVEKGSLSIEYCPTDVMWADFMTKPLQGEKICKFCDKILGQSSTEWTEWEEVA